MTTLSQSPLSFPQNTPEEIFPGVWRIRIGEPENHTPLQHLLKKDLAKTFQGKTTSPSAAKTLQYRIGSRGILVSFPLDSQEDLFGLGLQFHALKQTGRKKTLRVNSDPTTDQGDSHAPVPFFVSTKGYGLYFDTVRKATFYMGRSDKDLNVDTSLNSEEKLYGGDSAGGQQVEVEIPYARGVDVLFFEGPKMRDVIALYNRFSGGGCLPPLWGMGVWYRGHLDWNEGQARAMIAKFRAAEIPCDVLGLEPGWQTTAYSCSYVWNPKRFPSPATFVAVMIQKNIRVNLWEHGFVHPTSPLFKKLSPLSGNIRVWGGLVPDFTLPETKEAFTAFHESEHIETGVSGYKLDECDGSDYKKSPWSFPDHSEFPGGTDGEQMHGLFGALYQDTLEAPFRKRNTRTYGLVRSSHSFSAPRPYVLYSDFYDHRAYVRALASSGFCGLLWTPEVRNASSRADLLRRLQTVVFSPLAGINAWYIPHPPWTQLNKEKNQRGELDPEAPEIEAACREILRLRMQFIPYFYSAFARYHFEGIPPFRALVVDFPDDLLARNCDDCYMAGESLLVAPLFGEETERKVYLPQGDWYNFWSEERLEGGREYTIFSPPERAPLFVKSGSILPLADPLEFLNQHTLFNLRPRRFGETCAPFNLFVDDGVSFDFEEGRYAWQMLAYEEMRQSLTLSDPPPGLPRRYELASGL